MICFIDQEFARGGVTQEGTLGVGEKGSGFVTCSRRQRLHKILHSRLQKKVSCGGSGFKKSDPIDLRKHGQEQRRATQGKKTHTDGTGMGRWGDLSRPQNLYALGGITLGARPGQDHASALLWGPQMDSERKVKLHAVTREVTPNQRKPTTNWGEGNRC
jgi:hypothetical protein